MVKFIQVSDLDGTTVKYDTTSQKVVAASGAGGDTFTYIPKSAINAVQYKNYQSEQFYPAIDPTGWLRLDDTPHNVLAGEAVLRRLSADAALIDATSVVAVKAVNGALEVEIAYMMVISHHTHTTRNALQAGGFPVKHEVVQVDSAGAIFSEPPQFITSGRYTYTRSFDSNNPLIPIGTKVAPQTAQWADEEGRLHSFNANTRLSTLLNRRANTGARTLLEYGTETVMPINERKYALTSPLSSVSPLLDMPGKTERANVLNLNVWHQDSTLHISGLTNHEQMGFVMGVLLYDRFGNPIKVALKFDYDEDYNQTVSASVDYTAGIPNDDANEWGMYGAAWNPRVTATYSNGTMSISMLENADFNGMGANYMGGKSWFSNYTMLARIICEEWNSVDMSTVSLDKDLTHRNFLYAMPMPVRETTWE